MKLMIAEDSLLTTYCCSFIVGRDEEELFSSEELGPPLMDVVLNPGGLNGEGRFIFTSFYLMVHLYFLLFDCS